MYALHALPVFNLSKTFCTVSPKITCQYFVLYGISGTDWCITLKIFQLVSLDNCPQQQYTLELAYYHRYVHVHYVCTHTPTCIHMQSISLHTIAVICYMYSCRSKFRVQDADARHHRVWEWHIPTIMVCITQKGIHSISKA